MLLQIISSISVDIVAQFHNYFSLFSIRDNHELSWLYNRFLDNYKIGDGREQEFVYNNLSKLTSFSVWVYYFLRIYQGYE